MPAVLKAEAAWYTHSVAFIGSEHKAGRRRNPQRLGMIPAPRHQLPTELSLVHRESHSRSFQSLLQGKVTQNVSCIETAILCVELLSLQSWEWGRATDWAPHPCSPLYPASVQSVWPLTTASHLVVTGVQTWWALCPDVRFSSSLSPCCSTTYLHLIIFFLYKGWLKGVAYRIVNIPAHCNFPHNFF